MSFSVNWKSRLPTIPSMLEQTINTQSPKRLGISKVDHQLWQFARFLEPEKHILEQKTREFDSLFEYFSKEIKADIDRKKKDEQIPDTLNFNITRFISGSFGNKTYLKGYSDMDVIFILNSDSPCLIKEVNGEKALFMDETRIGFGIYAALNNAINTAIQQLKMHDIFIKFNFKESFDGFVYTFVGPNVEIDVVPVLTTGSEIYYFVRQDGNMQAADIVSAVKSFNSEADNRKGLTDMVRCLKLAKQLWNDESTYIPSCIFDATAYRVAIEEKNWNVEYFKNIWKLCWNYILERALDKEKKLPAMNDPTSDLLQKVRSDKFAKFCEIMTEISSDEEAILLILAILHRDIPKNEKIQILEPVLLEFESQKENKEGANKNEAANISVNKPVEPKLPQKIKEEIGQNKHNIDSVTIAKSIQKGNDLLGKNQNHYSNGMTSGNLKELKDFGVTVFDFIRNICERLTADPIVYKEFNAREMETLCYIWIKIKRLIFHYSVGLYDTPNHSELYISSTDKDLMKQFQKDLGQPFNITSYFHDIGDFFNAEYLIIMSDSAVILLSHQFFSDKTCLFEFLILKSRITHKLALANPLNAIFDAITEEPDRNFGIFVISEWSNIKFFKHFVESFSEFKDGYKNRNYNNLQYEVGAVKNAIECIATTIKPKEEDWVFGIFSENKVADKFGTDYSLGTAKLFRSSSDNSISLTVNKLYCEWKHVFDSANIGVSWKLERKDDGVSLNENRFDLVKHGRSKGILSLNGQSYKCFAGCYDSKVKGNLSEKDAVPTLNSVLISKFHEIRELMSVLDTRLYTAAPHKSLIYVCGDQDLSDKLTIEKLCTKIAKSNPEIIYCGSRVKKNHFISWFRIKDCGVIVWFEEDAKNSASISNIDKLNPDSIAILQLMHGEDDISIVPIKFEVGGANLKEEDVSKIYAEWKHYVRYPSNFRDTITAKYDLLKTTSRESIQRELDDEYLLSVLAKYLEESNRGETKKIFGFRLSYKSKPKPSIIPSHPIELAYCISKIMPVAKNEDTVGIVGIEQDKNYNHAILSASENAKRLADHSFVVHSPLKPGSTFMEFETTSLVKNELQLTKFISSLENEPFSPFGFEISELKWSPGVPKDAQPSEVIASLIRRKKGEELHPPRDLSLKLRAYDLVIKDTNNFDSSAAILFWCLATLRILDNWKSLEHDTPLRGEAFVPLKFCNRSLESLNNCKSSQNEYSSDACSIQNLLHYHKETPILILGNAGQGKTTLLRRLSFMFPGCTFQDCIKNNHQLIKSRIKILPQDFSKKLVNLFDSDLHPAFENNEPTEQILIELILKQEKIDIDIFEEYAAVFWLNLCEQVYLEISANIATISIMWNSVTREESSKAALETMLKKEEMLQMADYLHNQSEISLNTEQRWKIAVALCQLYFTEPSFSGSNETCRIALLVRSDQLWSIRNKYPFEEQNRHSLMKKMLKFHMANLKMQDKTNKYCILEETARFYVILNILLSPASEKILMLDAVDEISIGERMTDEFKEWIVKVVNLSNEYPFKLFDRIIVTGRYCALQPIPEHLQTVFIVSLTKLQCIKYISGLLRRWIKHDKQSFDKTMDVVLTLKDKMSLDASPLLLLFLTIIAIEISENDRDISSIMSSITYYDLYEKVIKSFYKRCKKEKPQLLQIGTKNKMQWTLDMFSLFGFIVHAVGAEKGVTVVEKFNIAFMFEQFRKEGNLCSNEKVTEIVNHGRELLEQENFIQSDSSIDEFLATWCMIALGVVSSAPRNPKDRLDDVIQFQHRTLQEFLAARALSRSEKMRSTVQYPTLNKISVIGDFDWAEDKFVCSDWWDFVRKFIVSKHGIHFLAKKILSIKSNKESMSRVEIWADNIINNGGVDDNDLGHVRLTLLLNSLLHISYRIREKKNIGEKHILKILQRICLVIGNNQPSAMCYIFIQSASSSNPEICEEDLSSNLDKIFSQLFSIENNPETQILEMVKLVESIEFDQKGYLSVVLKALKKLRMRMKFDQGSYLEEITERVNEATTDSNESYSTPTFYTSPIPPKENVEPALPTLNLPETNTELTLMFNENDSAKLQAMDLPKRSNFPKQLNIPHSTHSGGLFSSLRFLYKNQTQSSPASQFKDAWDQFNHSPDSLFKILQDEDFPLEETWKKPEEWMFLLNHSPPELKWQKKIWGMSWFPLSIKDISEKTFSTITLASPRNLSPIEKAIFVIYRMTISQPLENCISLLNHKRSIHKIQEVMNNIKLEISWNYFDTLIEWKVILLKRYWYDWIEKLLRVSINARNECGKEVQSLQPMQLLSCQPFFLYLSQSWRRFVIKQDSMTILEPLCQQDEAKKFVPQVERTNGENDQLAEINNPSTESNKNRENLFFEMCRIGDMKEITKWIQNGNSINLENSNGDTPLHIALRYRHSEVAKLLINKGAKINETNKDRDTPLHIASRDGHAQVSLLLIDKGAHINEMNRYGNTPIHCASDIRVVKRLIDKGANIFWTNKYGDTPLDIAFRYSHMEVAQLLIDRGANFKKYEQSLHKNVISSATLQFRSFE